MPTPNLLNPAGDPVVDERLRGVGQYMGEAAQDPVNFGKGLLSAALGLSGDVQELGNQAGTGLLSLLSRQPVTGPLMSGLVNYQGRSAPTSRELGAELGADLDSPGYQVGEFGAPDLTDVARHSPTLAALFLHGSPHKWSKPATMEELARHMGSGEGAQAFGWGMYFAENPKVAGGYQAALSRVQPTGDASQDLANFALSAKRGDNAKAIKMLEDDLAYYEERGFPSIEGQEGERLQQAFLRGEISQDEIEKIRKQSYRDQYRKAIDIARANKNDFGGHLYEVDIPDEVVDQMLDWDAPLSEQPEILRLLEENVPNFNDLDLMHMDSFTGEQLYRKLGSALKPDEPLKIGTFGQSTVKDVAASEWLRSFGIPGIRFYDGGSRNLKPGRNLVGIGKNKEGYAARVRMGAGGDVEVSPRFQTEAEAKRWANEKLYEGATRNIVVFDPDSSIKSVKRDGELVWDADEARREALRADIHRSMDELGMERDK